MQRPRRTDLSTIGGYTSLNAWQGSTGSPDANGLEGGAQVDGDYKPVGNSLLIDTGLSLSDLFTTDLAGSNRPMGNAWDMGAYEYTSDPSPSPPSELRLLD